MVRSRFLMQNVILKLTDIMRIIFLFTKLKHYSVISGKVSREKGVQVDGFRVSPWGGSVH